MYPDLDVSTWQQVHVPGHWVRNAGFDGCESVLYRTTYTSDLHSVTNGSEAQSARHWLTLGGIWQGADVWFDGTYLGPTDCWFAPDQFEITKLIRPGSEHIVAIETHAKRAKTEGVQSDLSGIFSDPNIVGDTEPGGILSPIKISTTGPAKFTKQHAICVSATPEAAAIALRAQIDSSKQQTAFITTTLLPPNAGAPLATRRRFDIEAGPCEIEWSAAIAQPELWWPWELGPQPLYRITVTIECDGKISDIWEKRIGLREISMSDMTLSINGQQLFTRGADLWPCEVLPTVTDGYSAIRKAPAARCHPSESERDITDPKADLALAKDLGLNMVRVDSHIASPEVYAAADQLGMLIWQDFPLRGRIDGEALSQAIDAVGRLVETLGSYPSIAIWSTHTQPDVGTTDTSGQTFTNRFVNIAAGPLLSREFQHFDPSRPVISASGRGGSTLALLARDTKRRGGEILRSTRSRLKGYATQLSQLPTRRRTDSDAAGGADAGGGGAAGAAGGGGGRDAGATGTGTGGAAGQGRPQLPAHIWTEDNVNKRQSISDSRLRFGWNTSTFRALARYLRRNPNKAHWVSSFGSQSIPVTLIDRLEPLRFNRSLPKELATRYGADIQALERYVDREQHTSVTHWAAATQDYQGELLRRQIEILRRLKYRPTGGFIFSALADCRPAISFAIYDHLRNPKAAVEQVKAACQPVIIVADVLEPVLAADSALLVDIHIVNDRKLELTGLTATAELSWNGGSHKWGWVGTVGEDTVQRIGSLNWITTKKPGPVTLELSLSRGGAVLATNQYQSNIEMVEQ